MADKKLEIPISTPADLSGAKETVRQLGAVKQAVKETSAEASKLKLGDIPGLAAFTDLTAAGVTAAGFAFLKQSIAAANESAASQVLLNNALQNTSQYSQAAAEHIGELAGAQQDLTNVSDETWSDALASLIQYGAKVEDLESLTPILEGLAGRMGGDVAGAARVMSLALAGNVRGLVQFGIRLDETATKADIMNALIQAAAKGQGLLREQTQTLEGSLTTLKVAWGDLQEEVGKNLTQGGELGTVLQAGAASVRFVTKHVNELISTVAAVVPAGAALKVFSLVFGEAEISSLQMAANVRTAAAALRDTGEAAEEASAGLETTTEDTKAAADEMKRLATESKATEDALKKIADLKREIAEQTETPQEKSKRLQAEEAEAQTTLAKDFKNILRRPMDPQASASDLVREISNPISGVNDPAAQQRLLEEVKRLIDARGAVSTDQEAIRERNRKEVAGNQAEETPEARARRLAYEKLNPDAKAAALGQDAVAGRGGEGGYTGQLIQAANNIVKGLKDGDQGGEKEALLKALQEIADHAKNSADDRKRLEARIEQVAEQIRSSRA